MVDNPEFRDKLQEALEKSKGHEPYESGEDCEYRGEGLPLYEGTTLREAFFYGTGEGGNTSFSNVSILGPVDGNIIYNPNHTCRLHTHPNHDSIGDGDSGYDGNYGYPEPKGDDTAVANHYPVKNDFIATEDHLVRYDEFGNITDSWRIEDLNEPCCNK